MSDSRAKFRKSFLLFLIVGLTLAMVWMLWSFLLTILMAAIFGGLLQPVYTRLVRAFGGRKPAAAATTLVGALVLVVAPLTGVASVVVSQAVGVTENVRPFVERLVNEPTYLDQQLSRVPGIEYIEPYREQIVTRAGEVVSSLGGFLVGSLSSTTMATITFVVHFFLFLYTLFFFLIDGPGLLSSTFTFFPLQERDEQMMKERFLSVTRATIKGTLVIGLIQGALSGLAFAVVGIPNALFWTVVMAVLSVLPLVGGALVWVPAALILVATGQVLKGVLLAIFCALVVGSVDNVLRPRLVGRDTKMHDLLILFSTLGGIAGFGAMGFIVGPILAGLFLTTWEIFRESYREELAPDSGRVVVLAEEVAAADTPPTVTIEIP